MTALVFNLCLSFVRNVFGILRHMWHNCSVRCKVGSWDHGVNTRRISIIEESIFSKKKNFACLCDSTSLGLNKQNSYENNDTIKVWH